MLELLSMPLRLLEQTSLYRYTANMMERVCGTYEGARKAYYLLVKKILDRKNENKRPQEISIRAVINERERHPQRKKEIC